jgi:hypothetical protein
MGSGAGARLPYAIALLLVVVTCAVYWQVTGFQFVHYDEDMYVLDNPNVQRDLSWASARWAFRATVYSTWQPMVWLSYMADYHLNGLDPGAFHLTNLILHAVSTVLLFALLARATGSMWRSAFVSALFALHPQHVESVAWIAERKDVLSTLFWFAATLCYVRYAEKPCVRRYVWVVVLYALGLMAKPMLVTLPLTGYRGWGPWGVPPRPKTQDPTPETCSWRSSRCSPWPLRRAW